MRMLSVCAFAFLLAMASATKVFAQVDRARGEPFADFTKYYNQVVSSAEQNQRDKALEAMTDMGKALNAIFDFSKDAPGKLKEGNLPELGSKAEEFLRSINDFRDKGSSLLNKVRAVGESYSSELSAFKSANETLRSKFNSLWEGLQTSGKDVSAKYEAIKATCMVGCLAR